MATGLFACQQLFYRIHHSTGAEPTLDSHYSMCIYKGAYEKVNGLLEFLFMASVLALLIGLIKPGIVLRWGRKRSRGRVALTYGLASLLFLSAGAATTPAASTSLGNSTAYAPQGNTTATNAVSTQQNSVSNNTSNSTTSTANVTNAIAGTVPSGISSAAAQTNTSSMGQGRSNPLAGVYHPYRLEVLAPLKTVSGVIYSIRHESDKDYHINLKLDPQYANLINAKNISVEHGCLVVEVIPMDAGKVPVPSVGQHVSVTGAYVLDKAHGWNEIHPAWLINGKGSVNYTQAEAASSVQIGLVGNGDEKTSGTTTSSSSSTSTSSSSSSPSLKVTSSNLNVSHGDYASVTIQTAPGATGTIEVDYSSGPSTSSSLVPKTSDSSGHITWEWKVGTRTTPGTWPVIITVNGKSIQVSLIVH